MTRRLLAPPDELELDAGARGELAVARVRLALVLLLAPIPVINALELRHRENWVGAAVAGIGIVMALIVHQAARRNPRRTWLGIVSTTIDITLITLGLATFLVLGEPITATNSLVLFGVYYIAIMGTTLRHDPRLALLAGILAVAQYGTLVLIAATQFDLMDPNVYSVRYGSFSWGSQIGRLLLLTAAASVATIVILRQGDLLHRSSVDWLTRLYNRGAFDDRLETEVTRSRRHGHPLSVAIVDIDHFKRINDGHGHAAGDEALKQFAEAMINEFRKTDVIARLGGEEFVVMMPETPPEAATAKAERFVHAIGDGTFTVRRGTELHMTVSVGVAGVPADATTSEQLMEVADARLLEAKRAGRNRVVGVGTGAAETA